MAKRFTATEKWDDPWFCSLSSEEKLFWIYLLDKCDHAGIWQVNWKLAAFHIPGLTPKEGFHGRVEVLSSDKWFIPKFVDFQYGVLDSSNRAHNSVIRILEKEGAYKGHNTPLIGCKDKDMDKDMDKDKEKEKVKPTKLSQAELEKAIEGPDHGKRCGLWKNNKCHAQGSICIVKGAKHIDGLCYLPK